MPHELCTLRTLPLVLFVSGAVPTRDYVDDEPYLVRRRRRSPWWGARTKTWGPPRRRT